MKKLLADYGFSHSEQYFEMVVESYSNGQRQQCSDQFLALSKQDRKDCFLYIADDLGVQSKPSLFVLSLI